MPSGEEVEELVRHDGEAKAAVALGRKGGEAAPRR